MKFKIIILLILLLNVNTVSGRTVASTYSTIGNIPILINNETYNNLQNQIIIKIPFDGLIGIEKITGIEFLIERTYEDSYNNTNPNAPLNLRIYYYDDYFYYYADNINIPQNAPLEGLIKINHVDLPILSIYKGIAYGFYSSTSNNSGYKLMPTASYDGTNYFLYKTEIYNYYLGDLTGKYITVEDVNGNYIYDSYYIDEPLKLIGFNFQRILGRFKIPPTPQPTPTIVIPSNGSEPLPDSCTFEDLINDLCNYQEDYLPNQYTYIDFDETLTNISNTSCPDCLGNETINPNTFSNEKTLTKTLKIFGYCSSKGCTIYDIINFLYDISIGIFILSGLIIFKKFFINNRS